MKTIILAALLLSGAAQADTLVSLAPPYALANVHTTRCAAEGFTADGAAVTGACQYTLNCTARGCHGASYTYAETWALDGTATLGVKRAASPNFFGTGTVVTLDGHAYYYAATSVLGAIAAGTGSSALLWQP